MIKFKQFISEEKHPALKRAGVSGFSKPKRTPGHPTKSHIVVVKDGGKVKTIRFGQQGAETAGDPKKGELCSDNVTLVRFFPEEIVPSRVLLFQVPIFLKEEE